MEKKINHAIIMAAGRGSRMMPLTTEIPKAMAKLGESTLILSGIDKMKPYIDHIHITVGYKKAELSKHVIEHDIDSVLNTEGKGNAWWVYNSLLSNLDEPLFVLTCDNVVDIDFREIAEDYYKFGAPPCMVVPVTPVEGLEGDYIFCDNEIVTDLDRSKPTDIYCSGIQVLNPVKVKEVTRECEDFYSLWNQLIDKKQLLCSSIRPKKWFTIDTPEQLDQANRVL